MDETAPRPTGTRMLSDQLHIKTRQGMRMPDIVFVAFARAKSTERDIRRREDGRVGQGYSPEAEGWNERAYLKDSTDLSVRGGQNRREGTNSMKRLHPHKIENEKLARNALSKEYLLKGYRDDESRKCCLRNVPIVSGVPTIVGSIRWNEGLPNEAGISGV
ncbi:hypothetical protein K438DRAFT_1787429 [Mycena galopus ATCC 62051]|nr:hypothetical protein K438DRAFT_1787429 [Mycena galopus ATCC 62051]